jgi:hypothetical protein
VVTSSYCYDLEKSQKNDNHNFFYNSKYSLIGYYYLSLYQEKPYKLENNILFFKRFDCNNQVQVKFGKEILKFINIPCNKENSFYEFTYVNNQLR